ncbi:MAG: hypothetical protein ACR2QV_15395 [Gammaproteobacteria bacterium]
MPAAKPTQTNPPDTYKFEGVEKSKAPDGGDGKDWFRYTITQGGNTITGYRQGSQRAVTKAVKQIVLDLNERRGGKKGRVHLTPSRKKAANG